MQLLRTWIVCPLITLLGLCLPCCAEMVAHADLRSGVPEPSDYYVVICARESEELGSGHNFVVWVQQDKRTGKRHSQGFGYYPGVEKVVVRLFTGKGAIRDESTRPAPIKPSLLTHRLIVQVDREAFEASLNVKEQWRSADFDYHLLNRNCTHFAFDVMKAIQLGVPGPEFGELPASYVDRLMTLELGRNRTRLERLPAIFVNGKRLGPFETERNGASPRRLSWPTRWRLALYRSTIENH